MFRTQASWKSLSLSLLCAVALSACSKAEKAPQVFVPRILDKNGEDLDAVRLASCSESGRIDLRGEILTPENFRTIFKCANYDRTLNDLEPLFNSEHFTPLLKNINLVLKSDSTRELKDTLRDWLQEEAKGGSRLDRLLPFLASMIKNPSFQDFLPVFDGILQAGKEIWNDLFPGLADVIYNERFPNNMEDAIEIFSSFSGAAPAALGEAEKKENKDYATGIKDIARFLKMEVDGKSAALRGLELLNDIRNMKLSDNFLYAFIENMLEKGTLSAYFTDNGAIRGEVVDNKINSVEDPAGEACEGLNETPEQRQECAHQRMFQRTADGGDAPLTQLAGLITELQKDHPEMIPSLANWFASNGPRVVNGMHGYVIRVKISQSLNRLNVGNYLKAFAQKQGMAPGVPVTPDQFVELVSKGFADPDFATYAGNMVPSITRNALGERNANIMKESMGVLVKEIVSIYTSKEVAPFARSVFPANTPTLPLTRALSAFNTNHQGDLLPVDHNGVSQSIEKHLISLWWTVASTALGEDVVLEFGVKLAQSFLSDMAEKFKGRGQPIAEWYYTSPYGNPGTTEMILGFAVGEIRLLERYKKHKNWLRNEWVNEVFESDDDKRAARLLIDQVPNIVLYIRSGMSRSGSDLTRALARDKDGFLVRSYVQLVVAATESGLVRKGVRLIEAWQNRPGKSARAKAFSVSDSMPERRKYKKGVEASERILRSFIQPEREGDYSTSTLGRLITPLSSIVSDARRAESEKFLKTSADQLLSLSDEQINEFFGDLNKVKTPQLASDRRETFRAASDLLRNRNFPDVVRNLSGLFQDKAVRPALKFLQEKVDDGTLPNVLVMIRRILGYSS